MASDELQPASGQVSFSAREMLQYFEELDELLIDAAVSAPLHLYSLRRRSHCHQI